MIELGNLNNIKSIIQKKNIWIYGIGRKGKRVLCALNSMGITASGILVSSMSGNIDCYMGIAVNEISAVRLDETDFVLVAIDGGGQNDVVRILEKKGINYVIWTKELLCEIWKPRGYGFLDQSKNFSKLCVVLCGYKNYLWNNVFKRLENYIPLDVDVCLCSAGRYVKSLSDIAKRNGWSYLYIKQNSVSMIQNLCIALHANAEWVYKMDEDMFVTKNTFENLMDTVGEIKCTKKYELGIISPMIPLNANCYRMLLEKYNVLELYERKFGSAVLGGNPNLEIEKNPDAAKFMWSKVMPHLDVIAKDIDNEEGYHICGTRLSIGFVLFNRSLWEDMQGFVVYGNMDLGIDEEDVNSFCINQSRVMAIAKNAIVGHFGFGKQTDEMKDFYKRYQDRF